QVRIRDWTKRHRRAPERDDLARGGRRDGRRQRSGARRTGRHRRPDPARAGHSRDGPDGRRSGEGVVNLSAIFIKRPVTTTLIMLGTALFGIMAYRLLPVSDLPNVDFPTILVTAGLPGASPETMASAVALPLEKQFATIAGVTSMSSSSNPDTTSITLQF